jgi:hypothetical protein
VTASPRSPKGLVCVAFIATVIAVLSMPAAALLLGLVDGLSHPPPALGPFAYNTFVPPVTPGASYVDPVFGTTVLRVTTDHSVDDLYARNMWWSADETRYLHRNPNGTAFADFLAVITVATGQVTHNGIPIGTLPGDEGFDPVNANVLYYHSGSSLHQVTLGSNGTWTDSIYFTAPGGATLGDLGGTINWLDASGRYRVVRYGPAEPRRRPLCESRRRSEHHRHGLVRRHLARWPVSRRLSGRERDRRAVSHGSGRELEDRPCQPLGRGDAECLLVAVRRSRHLHLAVRWTRLHGRLEL